MNIIQLNAENIKCLKAIEIKPTGSIVEISGRNGQGKTSVLDAIWFAAGGTKPIPSMPIRKGQKTAKITLDLGDIKVIRRFTAQEGGGYKTDLRVEDKDGRTFKTPQAIMDSMFGSLTFDPLAFTRMDDRAQLNELKRYVPTVDFVAIERANQDDYDKRTDENREAKSLRTRAAAITLPDAIADARVDEHALVEQLQSAGDHNTLIERRRSNRIAAAAEVVRLGAEAARCREEAAVLLERAVGLEADTEERCRQIDGAEPLSEPVDTRDLTARISAARDANRWIDLRESRDALIAQAVEVEARSQALTDAIEARKADMRAEIAKADLPLPGLGFGDDEMLLNGVPFSQASGAERLRTSVAIAMAANPRLRVLRIQDGSLLDDEAMGILTEMAEAANYQVWVEVVQSNRPAAVIIEDGQVLGTALAVAAE